MHLYASIKFIYFVSDVYERGVVRKMHFNMIAVFFFFYMIGYRLCYLFA